MPSENSAILTSNVLLMDHDQGSQHFDWSRRKSTVKENRNRFRMFKNQETTTNKEDLTSLEPTTEPVFDSTEVHVVTSQSDEIHVDVETTPASSYQYVSIGTPIPSENILELERLFLNENLKPEGGDPEKKKRKVVMDDPKPVMVDSSIIVGRMTILGYC